jgi:hypothetical protein
MRKDAESGYVLVTVSALLVVLVGFTALAVDMGTILSSRTQLQRGADAAALAGAFIFAQSPYATETMATDRAKYVLAANKDMGDAIDTSTGVTVTVKCPTHSGVSCSTSASTYQVTVEIQRTESMIFGTVLAVSGVADKVSATAEVGTNAEGVSCMKPWFLPNTVADTTDQPCTATTNGNVLMSNQADGSWAVTQYGLNHIGAQLLVKPQDSKNALQSSQFFTLDVSQYTSNGGAKSYGTAISSCDTYQFQCGTGNSYVPLTGDKKGPTISGVCTLISGNSDCSKGGTPDTYYAPGQYIGADGVTISDTSKSLVFVPIVDLNSVTGFCPTNTLPSSNTPLSIVGFAQLFIKSVDKNTAQVTAYLVNIWGCGPDSGSDSGAYGSPVPLRLIRTQ